MVSIYNDRPPYFQVIIRHIPIHQFPCNVPCVCKYDVAFVSFLTSPAQPTCPPDTSVFSSPLPCSTTLARLTTAGRKFLSSACKHAVSLKFFTGHRRPLRTPPPTNLVLLAPHAERRHVTLVWEISRKLSAAHHHLQAHAHTIETTRSNRFSCPVVRTE